MQPKEVLSVFGKVFFNNKNIVEKMRATFATIVKFLIKSHNLISGTLSYVVKFEFCIQSDWHELCLFAIQIHFEVKVLAYSTTTKRWSSFIKIYDEVRPPPPSKK